MKYILKLLKACMAAFLLYFLYRAYNESGVFFTAMGYFGIGVHMILFLVPFSTGTKYTTEQQYVRCIMYWPVVLIFDLDIGDDLVEQLNKL